MVFTSRDERLWCNSYPSLLFESFPGGVHIFEMGGEMRSVAGKPSPG